VLHCDYQSEPHVNVIHWCHHCKHVNVIYWCPISHAATVLAHSGQVSTQDRNTQACLGALQAIYANDEAQFEDELDREGNGGTGCHHDASFVAAPTGLSRSCLFSCLQCVLALEGKMIAGAKLRIRRSVSGGPVQDYHLFLHDARQSAGRPTFNASASKTEGPFRRGCRQSWVSNPSKMTGSFNLLPRASSACADAKELDFKSSNWPLFSKVLYI
jgi:hypothetical protein